MKVIAKTDFISIGHGEFKKGYEYEVDDINGLESFVSVVQPEIESPLFETPEDDEPEIIEIPD